MIDSTVSEHDRACLVALASLPFADHQALRRWLGEGTPAAAWQAIVEGRAGSARLTGLAQRVDPPALLDRHRSEGIEVLVPGDLGFPEVLRSDHECPPVLFARGESAEGLAGLDRSPTVGIIGTRRCTPYGRDVASELGRDLATAGVAVISGLAAGIDGAAHEGAVAARAGSAPPVAVVGSGLDVVYPRQHRRLWLRVAQVGVLVSEAPLGSVPEPWRFPARNRIIAALSDVIVVVESHAAGGSMHTVRSAIDRGVPVMAVPGSIRSPASAGTNLLLAEGVPPVGGVDDVLVALSLERAGSDQQPLAPVVDVGDDGREMLEALGWEPADLDTLIDRTGWRPAQAAMVLNRLEQQGAVSCEAGWWRRR